MRRFLASGVPVEELLGAGPGALMLASGLGAWWRARRYRRAANRAVG